MTAADSELRRIERALHDGVQQDLVAFSVRLQLAQRLAASDLPAALALLAEIEDEVRGALDRVRTLANGVYPSVLDARGLPDALRAAASAAGVALTLDADGAGRYPAEVEAAVYFFCRAALVAAGPRASIAIRDEASRLVAVIECEPADFELEAISERIEALGAIVTAESAAGTTRLTAIVPLYPPSER